VVKKVAFQQALPEVADRAAAHLRPMAMGPGGSPTLEGVGWHSIHSTLSNRTHSRPSASIRWASPIQAVIRLTPTE
jgi:hypothetical protein